MQHPAGATRAAPAGFKVLRYRDAQGNVCAFYDSTLLFPKDVLFNAAEGLGVVVLDMNDPAKPVKTDHPDLARDAAARTSRCCSTRSAACSPPCSATPRTNLGILDVYDVKTDCRHPQLLSTHADRRCSGTRAASPPTARRSTPRAPAARRSSRSTSPTRPRRRPIFQQFGVNYHGLRLSDDGRTMYVANIGNPTNGAFSARRAADPRRQPRSRTGRRPRGRGARPT